MKVIPARPTPRRLISDGRWAPMLIHDGWIVANAGSGVGSIEVNRINTNTGSTAGSTSYANNERGSLWNTGNNARLELNWSKALVLDFAFSEFDTSTNGINRVTLGKANGDGFAALNDKGIGIQIANGAISGVVHNGSTGASADLSSTATDEQVFRMRIESDGAGNIEWFLDGVSKGTSAAGPTGDSTSQHTVFQVESGNGADAEIVGLDVSHIWMWQEE